MIGFVLFRSFVFCAVLLAVVPSLADQITLTISQPLTGNLILNGVTTPLSNKVVTFQGTMTTESLAGCVAAYSGCFISSSGGVTEVDVDPSAEFTSIWSIEGFGTYIGAIPIAMFTFRGMPDHPTDISIVFGGDVEGHGLLPNPFIPNYNPPPGEEPCDDQTPCPVEINLYLPHTTPGAGTIQFLGIDGPAAFSATVTPENPVPEPSTFVLFTSGFSAGSLLLRRRRRYGTYNKSSL